MIFYGSSYGLIAHVNSTFMVMASCSVNEISVNFTRRYYIKGQSHRTR